VETIAEALPFLAEGALITLALAGASFALGLVLGLGAALARLSWIAPVRWIAQFYVDFVRGTPLLVQLFMIYYGLPQFGIRLDPFVAGTIALGGNYGAYLAEVFRGGLLAVDQGQWEAARSLDLPVRAMMTTIILPQAIRVALPGVGNYAIGMLKDTAQASVVTVGELLRQGQLRVAVTFRPFEIYLAVAVIYLLMSYPLTILVKRLEKRSGRGF